MSKKKLTVEEMKKAMEIEITPKEQKELQNMSWEEIMSKAKNYNPTIQPRKTKKKKK